jgi:tetratricopeptide (TPR) repeat protein
LVKAEKAALKHRYEEARKLYEYSLNLNLLDRKIPQKIQLLTAKINKQQQMDGLYEKGLYNDAVMGYIEALSDDKDNATLLAGRARCNARLGLDSRAEADFTKAIAIDNTNITTYKYMGEYYKNKRKPDYDKAYNAYASYVNFSENKEAPELPAIYSEMAVCKGQAAFAKNSISEALDSFGRAIEYYPQNAGAYLNKAICYYKQNNYTEALTNVEKSIELKEKNAEGHYWLGKIKLSNPSNKKDHTDEAIEELKLAISYNDNYLVANFDLGDLMQRKGTWADAIPYFTKCISIDSNFASAYWKRGLSHYHIASYAVAYTDFNRYALFDFVNLGFYVDFGNLYLQLMQPDNAITWFNKAPNSTESVFGIAVATYLKAPGDPQKKYIEYFEKAFIKGINADLVNASPVVKKLKNDDKDYKELIKKYKNYK